MLPQEDTINQYLQAMGYAVSLSEVQGFNNVKMTVISHMNVNMVLVLDQSFIYPVVNLGYLPQAGVASLTETCSASTTENSTGCSKSREWPTTR